MEVFVWDRNFSTGLPGMDDQHRGLIDIFNELHRTLFDVGFPADRRDVVLRRAFDRLMAYARNQFSAEETLMQNEGLDERHLFVHRRQHEQFIRNLRELWEQRDTLPDLSARMMGFLSSWIGLHILGVDQSMVRQMRLRQAGKSAADAFDHEAVVSDKGLRALLNMVGRLYQDLSQQTQVLGQTRQDLLVAEDAAHMLASRLEVHSRFDELLQVANRRYFEQRLTEEVSRAFRLEAPLSVLVVELDFFPHYGERLGLPAADACLQTVAHAVASAMKRTTDLVARHDHHRLVVMLPDTDRHGATLAAQRVVDNVALLDMPHPESAVAAVVTASVGVAGWVPRSREDGARLVAEAEGAVGSARLDGGNRVVVA
jgi:hemerythrin